MQNLNWLATDTVTRIQEEAKDKFSSLNTNDDYIQPEESFVQGFLEGINYLKEVIENTAKEKERTAATVRS